MTLPTFLGIGVPRAGTTWLHTLLGAHPDVYLPTRRKEVQFFDRYHDEGLEWYETFFCSLTEAGRYAAIGEISPQYLYCEECPDRIAEAVPGALLLVMLRHPVDRAYSNYGFVVQRRNYRGSFEEFLASRPDMLEKGFYSPHLKRYLRRFDRERILPIVFEDAMREGDRTRRTIAAFLDVPAEGFPTSLGKVNASTVPRHGALSSAAVKVGRRLRRRHLEAVVDLGARLGARRALSSGSPLPRIDPDLRTRLSRPYEREFDELEGSLGIDVSSWRKPVRAPESATS
ncbi:MAG: sulfotransferase family protein [Actinomycetota bacterium]